MIKGHAVHGYIIVPLFFKIKGIFFMSYSKEFWSVKSTLWFAVCYQESMISDWRDRIADILTVPGVYIEHLPDRSDKKEHVHVLFRTSNTTRRHARDMLNELTRPLTDDELSWPDRPLILACSTIQPVQGVKSCWDYMCHETVECIRCHDKIYPHENRISFNGFDYVSEIEVEEATLNEIRIELSHWIIETHCCYYNELYYHALSCNSELLEYEKCVVRYSAHFDRMCRSEYNKRKSIDNTTKSTDKTTNC